MKPSVRFDMTALNKFVQGLDATRQYKVKVGILANKTIRTEGGDGSNVEIGAKHEYGSISDHVPQRSFLRMPIFSKARQIISMTGKLSKRQLEAGDIKRVLSNLGVVCENVIGEAWDSGGFGQWAPLAPFTVAKKGHDLILIHSRQLQRSVTSAVVKI